MVDFTGWLIYLLYVEMGILVGVLFKDRFVPPKMLEGTLHIGTVGQFLLGVGVTFGFQLLGTDYMMAWSASTAVATTGNLLPVLFGRVTTAIETRRTQTSMDDIYELLTENKEMLELFRQILAIAEEKTGLATGREIESGSEFAEPTPA